MSWLNPWKRPKPEPMTPEEREVLDAGKEVVREAQEFVRWLKSLSRAELEWLRDRAIEREKRQNP